MIDAVIVLANEMDSCGVLNRESRLRLEKAVEVFNRLMPANIVTSGWAYRSDTKISIGQAFADYLVKAYGLDRQLILTDANSRDTVGDAYFTKVRFGIDRGWKSIIVVTSSYHEPRALEIFRFIYGASVDILMETVEVEVSREIFEKEKRSLQSFNKTFFGVVAGDDIAILQALRAKHPYYNGSIYPLI